MLDTLKTLCALPGVSGDEGCVRDHIVSEARKCGAEAAVDVMGNVVVFKKGAAEPKKRLMLAAHMDEVGVICVGHTDEGYLKFACCGGIDRRLLPGKVVYFRSGAAGVIGFKAIHLTTGEERQSVPKVDDMYIDVGADGREAAQKLVRPGDTGSFSPVIRELGGGLVRAKAIDDRVGCAVLLKLMREELPWDVTLCFTVQEEVGSRGAKILGYRLAPDAALILEGTTAADLPGVKGVKRITSVGGGAVIPFMDRATIYDRELFDLLSGMAEKNGVRWQTKSYIAGGTDGSALQRSRGGVKTAGIAVPVRNIHSPNCIASVEDMNAAFELARLFVSSWGELEI